MIEKRINAVEMKGLRQICGSHILKENNKLSIQRPHASTKAGRWSCKILTMHHISHWQKFLLQIDVWIGTKIQRLLLVKHNTLQKITRTRRLLFELSAKFVELPLSRNGKKLIPFKNSCIRIVVRITAEI